MICSGDQYGNQVVLRDRTGSQIGILTLGGGELLGNSRSFVVVRYGNMIYTMNENQQQLGSVPLPSDYRIQNITEDGFTARTGNMLQKYDMYCNHIGSTNV